MVALSKAVKEVYNGRMLQGNANTTINVGMNASKKKIRTEHLTIRAATVEQPSIKSSRDKQHCYFEDGSYRCYKKGQDVVACTIWELSTAIQKSAPYTTKFL